MVTKIRNVISAGSLVFGVVSLNAQTIPNAPATPACAMTSGRSNCQFKTAMTGTPTSVVGNRVVLFDRTVSGGHGTSRQFLRDALTRLDTRYGFDLVFTQDPLYFTAANLATTKVVLFSNGDGDVLPAGTNRTTLENFQQVNGWGVVWIHAACAFITTGWPYGQNSCVQQYYTHNGSGTTRTMFIDSGTTANPNQGIKNPQSEFLLRGPFPGTWGANGRNISMGDEWYSFQAAARNNSAVNVLFGYDEASGAAATVMGNANHNMVWTRSMGAGITVYNSWGHDVTLYSGYGGFGDTLLWRTLRYAAKDWEVAPTPVFKTEVKGSLNGVSMTSGTISISFGNDEQNTVSVSDITGKTVYSKTLSGVRSHEVMNMKPGIYFVKVASNKGNEVKKVSLY